MRTRAPWWIDYEDIDEVMELVVTGAENKERAVTEIETENPFSHPST